MGFQRGLLSKFASFEASKNPIPKRRKLLAKRPFLQANRALFEIPFKLDRVSFSTPELVASSFMFTVPTQNHFWNSDGRFPFKSLESVSAILMTLLTKAFAILILKEFGCGNWNCKFDKWIPNFRDKFGESLGGSQAPPSFWRVPGLPRKFPELPRKFFGDFPGTSLTVDFKAIQRFPGSSPNFPGSSPDFPGSFPDFAGGQPLSLGSLTPAPDSQKLSLRIFGHPDTFEDAQRGWA